MTFFLPIRIHFQKIIERYSLLKRKSYNDCHLKERIRSWRYKENQIWRRELSYIYMHSIESLKIVLFRQFLIQFVCPTERNQNMKIFEKHLICHRWSDLAIDSVTMIYEWEHKRIWSSNRNNHVLCSVSMSHRICLAYAVVLLILLLLLLLQRLVISRTSRRSPLRFFCDK